MRKNNKLTREQLHVIRFTNFQILIEEAGSIVELSRRSGYNKPAYLYQVNSTKPDSKGRMLNVGTQMARKLEAGMKKPKGWMDVEHVVKTPVLTTTKESVSVNNNQVLRTVSTAKKAIKMANRSVTLAWTGASGFPYGLRLLECLLQAGVEVNLVYSAAACIVAKQEAQFNLPEKVNQARTLLCKKFHVSESQLRVYAQNDWFAPIASGSSVADAMVICPVSMGTVSAIAHGASDTLLERAADVAIKEKRPVILVPRETPLSSIHLENLLKLSQNGCTILPPAAGFYYNPKKVSDMIDFVVARILDHLKVVHTLSKRWGN